jgi:hypothetical protein
VITVPIVGWLDSATPQHGSRAATAVFMDDKSHYRRFRGTQFTDHLFDLATLRQIGFVAVSSPDKAPTPLN